MRISTLNYVDNGRTIGLIEKSNVLFKVLMALMVAMAVNLAGCDDDEECADCTDTSGPCVDTEKCPTCVDTEKCEVCTTYDTAACPCAKACDTYDTSACPCAEECPGCVDTDTFAYDEMTEEQIVRAYGGYDPIGMTATHLLNEKAGIGWTSYSHTSVAVPVYAEGSNADMFDGSYDNTDIPAMMEAAMANGTKSIIFLIGDGMASVQVSAAQHYMASVAGAEGVVAAGTTESVEPVWNANLEAAHILNMSTMSYIGLATTHSYDAYITDSAAAATALACGIKTDSGVISMTPDLGDDCQTIAEKAAADSKSVGIVSSVSIDHATPACFYAHNTSRNNYHEIAPQAMDKDGFVYFGGSGPRLYKQVGDELDTDNNPVGDNGAKFLAGLATDGFTVTQTLAELTAAAAGDPEATKIFTLAHNSSVANPGVTALPYTLDYTTNDVYLSEYTEQGIDFLSQDADGFFLMVEGGKIDWAGHANDAAANIKNTIEFDRAVGAALEYAATDANCLVVVTGDHETGGMSIGQATTKYTSWIEVLDHQTVSQEGFDGLIGNLTETPASLDDLATLIEDSYGLNVSGTCDDCVDLSDDDMQRLEAAFQAQFGEEK